MCITITKSSSKKCRNSKHTRKCARISVGILIACLSFLTWFLLTGTYIPIQLILRENIKSVDGSSVNDEPVGDIGLAGEVELTIRMAATEKMIKRMLCSLLRSAVLFWNPKYGDVVVILDKDDSNNLQFLNELIALDLPFSFRFVYEEEPKEKLKIINIGRKLGKTYGYMRQLYSSFFMDLYTQASIIALIDTDVVFTMPVVDRSIKRNGKLIVKGMNTFANISWVMHWDHTNIIALGFPMVSDFMTYFPVYIYSSTIRSCRHYIMKRLGVNDFEAAFIKIGANYISPVSIIVSYAYHFERIRYEWHIDVLPESLKSYNANRLPRHPLLPADTSPELHVTVHEGYYNTSIHPLEQAVCYMQIYLGMKNLTHCRQYYHQSNMQLFEFSKDPIENHLETWCRKKWRKVCKNMINQRYAVIVDSYRNGELKFDTRKIEAIELLARKRDTICPHVNYIPFS